MDRAVAERVVAGLHEAEPTFDWVGIYWLEGCALVLGPFRGQPTDHDRIPIGVGVCGSVAASTKTEIVREVGLVEDAAREIAEST